MKIIEKFRKLHVFHSSRNFCKMEFCMVNNNDKSKVFCSNDFHVGGVSLVGITNVGI